VVIEGDLRILMREEEMSDALASDDVEI